MLKFILQAIMKDKNRQIRNRRNISDNSSNSRASTNRNNHPNSLNPLNQPHQSNQSNQPIYSTHPIHNQLYPFPQQNTNNNSNNSLPLNSVVIDLSNLDSPPRNTHQNDIQIVNQSFNRNSNRNSPDYIPSNFSISSPTENSTRPRYLGGRNSPIEFMNRNTHNGSRHLFPMQNVNNPSITTPASSSSSSFSSNATNIPTSPISQVRYPFYFPFYSSNTSNSFNSNNSNNSNNRSNNNSNSSSNINSNRNNLFAPLRSNHYQYRDFSETEPIEVIFSRLEEEEQRDRFRELQLERLREMNEFHIHSNHMDLVRSMFVQYLNRDLNRASGGDDPNINPLLLELSLTDRDFNDSDYESLLLLDETIPPKTVDKTFLSLLETRNVTEEEVKEEVQCSVCLDVFEKDSKVTVLPCHHIFHSDCIMKWLDSYSNDCPVCKSLVTDMMSEIIPPKKLKENLKRKRTSIVNLVSDSESDLEENARPKKRSRNGFD